MFISRGKGQYSNENEDITKSISNVYFFAKFMLKQTEYLCNSMCWFNAKVLAWSNFCCYSSLIIAGIPPKAIKQLRNYIYQRENPMLDSPKYNEHSYDVHVIEARGRGSPWELVYWWRYVFAFAAYEYGFPKIIELCMT